MDKQKNKSRQIKIEFSEETASVEYSNFVVVTHSIEVGQRANRIVNMRDGLIENDEKIQSTYTAN